MITMDFRALQNLQREIKYEALTSYGSSYVSHINKDILKNVFINYNKVPVKQNIKLLILN